MALDSTPRDCVDGLGIYSVDGPQTDPQRKATESSVVGVKIKDKNITACLHFALSL